MRNKNYSFFLVAFIVISCNKSSEVSPISIVGKWKYISITGKVVHKGLFGNETDTFDSYSQSWANTPVEYTSDGKKFLQGANPTTYKVSGNTLIESENFLGYNFDKKYELSVSGNIMKLTISKDEIKKSYQYEEIVEYVPVVFTLQKL